MKIQLFLFSITLFFLGCHYDYPITAKEASAPKTFCNPVNLNYRFMLDEEGRGIREAADPVLIRFKDRYYLFASKSSGYWHSTDFNDWEHVFIPGSMMPIEGYAPGLF